jgi:hypothetical protein
VKSAIYVDGKRFIETEFKAEEDIRKTDAEIDNLVYDIYGLTKAEREFIENSLK